MKRNLEFQQRLVSNHSLEQLVQCGWVDPVAGDVEVFQSVVLAQSQTQRCAALETEAVPRDIQSSKV